MYARVTLLEIDTVRTSVDDALAQFREQTLDRLRTQPGYRGVWVLTNADGKGLLMSLWETEDQASADGDHSFYAQELGHFTTLFRSPPGRERYEVVFTEDRASSGEVT
jgi:heme-degrading monooxygenase HmoA